MTEKQEETQTDYNTVPVALHLKYQGIRNSQSVSPLVSFLVSDLLQACTQAHTLMKLKLYTYSL